LKQYSKKFSYEDLIELNQNIKKCKYDIKRLQAEKEEIYEEWLLLGKLLYPKEGENNPDLSKFEKVYHLSLRPWFLRILAFFLILMSLATVLSEITLFMEKMSFSIFGLLVDSSENIFIINLLSLIPIIFLFLTSLYGLFNMKVSWFYTIHDNRHTDSISLLFLASFMCRIGFPLCLNFLQILKMERDLRKAKLIEVLGGYIDLLPLGKGFTVIFPTMLIFVCLFNLFDIFGRLMNFLGFSRFGFKHPSNDDKIEEGVEFLNKCNIFNNI
jgi:hypothetical protein